MKKSFLTKMIKSVRQLSLPSGHGRVVLLNTHSMLRAHGSKFYVIVFKFIRFRPSTRERFCCVFKKFHSGRRFQKLTVCVGVFSGYVWTERVKSFCVFKFIRKRVDGTRKTILRFEIYPDTYGRGLMLNLLLKVTKHLLLK